MMPNSKIIDPTEAGNACLVVSPRGCWNLGSDYSCKYCCLGASFASEQIGISTFNANQADGKELWNGMAPLRV